MARPPSPSISGYLADREAGGTPPPQGNLKITMLTLNAGTVLHRVHDQKFRANEFNPSPHANARFSPIKTDTGVIIPTLYGGVTKDCVLMETVFHDVSYTSGFKTLVKEKMAGLVHSTIETIVDLILADLSSVPLRKLGITRKELIDTEKDQYPGTRQWAEAIHRQCTQAQGLSWVSRQDDTARAVLLFGDRIPADALQQFDASLSLTKNPATYDDVLNLAMRLGVQIVPGKK